MKPLRELTDSPDEQVARAARLVSQVAPWDASDLRAARTRRSIESRESAGLRLPANLRQRRRGAILGAFVLGAVVSAGATYGVRQWIETDEAPTTSSAIDALDPPGTSTRPSPSGAEIVVDGTGSLPESQQEIPEPSPRSSSHHQAEAQKKPSTVAPEVRSAQPPTEASEAQLVQKAVKALRNSGDADRAEQLLQEYRAKSTSGQLDEEALALSIEVAMAKGDPKAVSYARSYLARYPHGRFQDLARRALAR
jgi:hypothetical protein